MVSPGTLRVLAELRESDRNVIEPTVAKTGAVTYPFVEQHLDDRDGDPEAFLEAMTDRELLRPAFEYKVYICPDCAGEGMQYSSGCPSCGSVHATREPVIVHATCGGTLESDSFEDGDDATCPGCSEDVTEADLERQRRYRCHDCGSSFDDPTHRLWCRDCDGIYPPAETHEEPLYHYHLTAAGEEWTAAQLEGRRSLADAFDARRYETSVDATITTADGEVPVHVYAEDGLLEDCIVADVHESPTEDDVSRLCEAAREVDARPVVLATDGTVDERVADLIDAEGVTVLSERNDELTSEYEIIEGPREPNSLLDRFVSALESSASRS